MQEVYWRLPPGDGCRDSRVMQKEKLNSWSHWELGTRGGSLLHIVPSWGKGASLLYLTMTWIGRVDVWSWIRQAPFHRGCLEKNPDVSCQQAPEPPSCWGTNASIVGRDMMVNTSVCQRGWAMLLSHLVKRSSGYLNYMRMLTCKSVNSE